MRVSTRTAAGAALALLVLAGPLGAEELLLRGARLIDGDGGPPRDGVAILVRDGLIAELGSLVPPPGARVIELDGRTLLPGLIDAHAHILDAAGARRALESWVTTARVLGDLHRQALGLRDLIRAGHVTGPELLASGGHVRPRPGEAFFQAYPGVGRFFGGVLSGPENVAEAVKLVLDAGADVIKVGASERAGLAETDPRRQELSEAELAAAVAAAAARGRHVAAHAHARAGAAAAVRAGVRSIEHGTYLDEETLVEMRRRGTFLVPTLAIMSPLGDPWDDSAGSLALRVRTHHMAPVIRAVVRRARELGIVVAAATDGGYGEGEPGARVRVAHDVEQLIGCGYTPLEAITAATANGARVLDIASRTGRIAAGLEADLLVVDRDPLADVTTLFEPLLVVSDGRVVLDRLALR